VTAFEVDHGIKPAYGNRVDYDGRSVLLSGDTKLSENVAKHGDGVHGEFVNLHKNGAARAVL
jgi:ribonuclease Z